MSSILHRKPATTTNSRPFPVALANGDTAYPLSCAGFQGPVIINCHGTFRRGALVANSVEPSRNPTLVIINSITHDKLTAVRNSPEQVNPLLSLHAPALRPSHNSHKATTSSLAQH